MVVGLFLDSLFMDHSFYGINKRKGNSYNALPIVFQYNAHRMVIGCSYP
jgi:hypothetical protein